MQFPDFLTQGADGEIRLTGHRIGLYHLVQHYSDGESAEMLACRYPTLPLSLVYKVLGFYLENMAAVDAYLTTCSAEMVKQEHHDVARPLNLKTLRERLQNFAPPAAEPQS